MYIHTYQIPMIYLNFRENVSFYIGDIVSTSTYFDNNYPHAINYKNNKYLLTFPSTWKFARSTSFSIPLIPAVVKILFAAYMVCVTFYDQKNKFHLHSIYIIFAPQSGVIVFILQWKPRLKLTRNILQYSYSELFMQFVYTYTPWVIENVGNCWHVTFISYSIVLCYWLCSFVYTYTYMCVQFQVETLIINIINHWNVYSTL